MPDFYEYMQRPLGGIGGDLLTVPRGLYHHHHLANRRPFFLTDWPPFSPAAALSPANHIYYGYYATAAAAAVSTYLRESSTAQGSGGTGTGAGSWVERPLPAGSINSGVAVQRRLHARPRPSHHLHQHRHHTEIVTSSSCSSGAAAAAAAAPDAGSSALAIATSARSSMKCLNDECKRAMKATNERWAAFNKQTYERIVDATLKEMTSSSPSRDEQQQQQQRTDEDEEDDDSVPEVRHKSPLSSKGHLQLARSITPIFRRSPGASRAREAMLRNRGHKGSVCSAPSKQQQQQLLQQTEGNERSQCPLPGKRRSEESEPLDLSTHSAQGRSEGDLSVLMARQADGQGSAKSAAAPSSPLQLLNNQLQQQQQQQQQQGLPVQTFHNWQCVRQSVAPNDPKAAAATAMAAKPRAAWLRAQHEACQAQSAVKSCQLTTTLSSAPARVGEGRAAVTHSHTDSTERCKDSHSVHVDKYKSDTNSRDSTAVVVTTPDATHTGQQPELASDLEGGEMSSGLAMSSRGGLRAKEDLWVPLNKDTVLGLVNDMVDSMVSSDLSDSSTSSRPYSGAQRGGSGPACRGNDSERTSTTPNPRLLQPRGIRRAPQGPPSVAKPSTAAVIESQTTGLSCPPASTKSTSQKENMHHPTRARPPASPVKGPSRSDNVDRWVAITKLAMRDIVENAIRCELEGEETPSATSHDRSDAPETCSKTSGKTDVGGISDVDHNANERPPSVQDYVTSSQGQSSNSSIGSISGGRQGHKRPRSPSSPCMSSASSCSSEGSKRTKAEEGATRSPLGGRRSPTSPGKVPQAGGRRSPPQDIAKGEATSTAITSHSALPKGQSRPHRASPPCTGPRRMPRTLDNPTILRPASQPPLDNSNCPSSSSNASRDRRPHTSGPSFKTPQVGGPVLTPSGPRACPSGPLSAQDARKQLTAWVAVSKNIVNSMIDDILVDKTDDTKDESMTSQKTEVTSESDSSSQGHDLQIKSCSSDCSEQASTTGDQDKSGDQYNIKSPSETPLSPTTVVPPTCDDRQSEHRPSPPPPPQSPTSSLETETTDSTASSSSDHVTSGGGGAICKSSFKLKSAMLERFNEERKSSTSSPSLPSPVTSSSASVTSSSPSVTPSPSPSSPLTTSKVRQTLCVSVDQEKGPANKGLVQNTVVAQKQGPSHGPPHSQGPSKSKKGHRSRQTTAAASKD